MTKHFTTDIAVVLVEPAYAGNIGSVARAMDNMGATQLRLVNPCDYLNSKSFAMATNSRWVLNQAQTYSTLREALADCHLVIGSSARLRQRHPNTMSLWNIDRIVEKYPTDVKIAVVFGREDSGLTNAEMDMCNEWVHIPCFGSTTSLNLSQAVILIFYELSRLNAPISTLEDQEAHPPATSFQIEGLKDHLFTVLKAIRFLRKGHESVAWSYFSDLIARAKLNNHDVKLLRGLFNKILLTIGAKKNRRKTNKE